MLDHQMLDHQMLNHMPAVVCDSSSAQPCAARIQHMQRKQEKSKRNNSTRPGVLVASERVWGMQLEQRDMRQACPSDMRQACPSSLQPKKGQKRQDTVTDTAERPDQPSA